MLDAPSPSAAGCCKLLVTIAEDAQDLGPAAVRALCFGKALPVVGTALTAVAVGYDIHNGVSVKSAVAAGLISAGAVVMAAGAVAGAPIGVVVALQALLRPTGRTSS